MDPTIHQEDFMQNIQGMIGNLLKNAIEKVQKTEMSKQIGGAEQDPADESDLNLMQTQLDIAEIKEIVHTMHKFLDNIGTMISQLESGNLQYNQDNDKFLDDYINTADNIFEIAAFSMKDSLTGLSNRYGFDNRLILEWNRAVRDKSSLSLFLISIDGFKAYKEAYGNQQGDVLLQAAAKVLEQSIKRNTDFCARLDDEFAIILSTTDVEGAKIVVERVLSGIKGIEAPFAGLPGDKLTVSIGASVHTPTYNEQAADFIAEAYKALKNTGGAGCGNVVIS